MGAPVGRPHCATTGAAQNERSSLTRPLTPSAVNVGSWPILLKKSVSNLRLSRPRYSKALDCEALTVSGWVSAWHRYQLRQLSEVLGGCCEKELITCTIRPS